jgi:hypothetical protein
MREVIRHWWVFGLRALLAFILAITLFLLQAWAKFELLDTVTVPFIIAALSLYGIMDSLIVIYLGWQFPPHSPARTISITQGISGIVLGSMLLTLWFRAVEIQWFLYLITAQAAATGVFEILSGLRFASHGKDEWACFASGAASIGFAILVQTTYSGSTSRALSWFLGYALLLCCSMGWFSFRLFALDRQVRAEQHAHQQMAASRV